MAKEDPERQDLKQLLQADSELSVKSEKIFRIVGFREVVKIFNENL